jgi:hypothetical protein
LGNKTETGWGVSIDQTYHVPVFTIPSLIYQIMGVLTLFFALFMVISAFWESWSIKVENYILKNLYPVLFIFYISSFLISYIKGIGLLVQSSQSIWIVDLVALLGLVLIFLIIAHFYKGIAGINKKPHTKSIPAQENSGSAKS